MQTKYTLWLDDEKDLSFASFSGMIFVAKSLPQAKLAVEEYGFPSFMYLDHDLGLDAKGNPVDSLMFLRWLQLEYPLSEPPGYGIISNNPVGRERIKAFMESWAKHFDEARDERLKSNLLARD
jgi:hypothetical protein